MTEVLYYAIPFFVLLLVVEALTYRHLQSDGLVGYELRDTRTSLAMGLGNVTVNVVWKLAVVAIYAALYELTPLRLDPGDWWVWVLLFFADDLAYYWFHRVSPREPRVLGEPRRPPLLPALQPLDGAAPDLGADDLPAVLAAAAAARLPAVDGPARAELEPDLPVRPPHGADREAAAAARGDPQHAVAPPRPPRRERAVPGPQLRRHPRHLGPAVRLVRARGRARPLRADDEHRDLQPRPGRVPRVHRAVARPARDALLARALEPAPARARLPRRLLQQAREPAVLEDLARPSGPSGSRSSRSPRRRRPRASCRTAGTARPGARARASAWGTSRAAAARRAPRRRRSRGRARRPSRRAAPRPPRRRGRRRA